MSALADFDREFTELRKRVEQLETLVRSGRQSDQPPRTAFRPSEVAKQVGVSTQTVRDWINDGSLKAERLNGLWIIPATAVDELLSSRRRSA